MDFFSEKVSRSFEADPREAFWTFSNFRDKVAGAPEWTIAGIINSAEQIENRALAMQKLFEKAACRSYAEDKAAGTRLLTNFSHEFFMSSFESMGSNPTSCVDWILEISTAFFLNLSL